MAKRRKVGNKPKNTTKKNVKKSPLKKPRGTQPKTAGARKPQAKKTAANSTRQRTTLIDTAASARTRGKKPIPEKSEEERRAALRKLLIQKREEIVREVKNEISKYIKGETRQLVDTALDDGDWSVVDLSEDISFKHMSTHRENLLKIDEAIRKLSEGTYGICEDCGEQISEKRLKILPFAIYCTDCQERREQLEELEKRESLIG